MKWGKRAMKSPTSLWNKTLLRHFVTQTIWITILYTVISLIVLPFSLWLSSFDMAGQERFDSEELLKSLAWIHLAFGMRSEEHTSELQSRGHLVCRLLLEKKNNF